MNDRSSEPAPDARIYVPKLDGWSVGINRDSAKEYCSSQKPGENYYHLLVGGEIYIQHGTDKFCLNCALRHGYVTQDRTFWQKGPSSTAPGKTWLEIPEQ